jgi:peptidoglycan L-alanyl-D-glutamate endopeptidase CwlK
MSMPYRLGPRSRSNLRGLHPDLVRVVERAIEITAQDFTVLEGVRTPQRQAEL